MASFLVDFGELCIAIFGIDGKMKVLSFTETCLVVLQIESLVARGLLAFYYLNFHTLLYIIG